MRSKTYLELAVVAVVVIVIIALTCSRSDDKGRGATPPPQATEQSKSKCKVKKKKEEDEDEERETDQREQNDEQADKDERSADPTDDQQIQSEVKAQTEAPLESRRSEQNEVIEETITAVTEVTVQSQRPTALPEARDPVQEKDVKQQIITAATDVSDNTSGSGKIVETEENVEQAIEAAESMMQASAPEFEPLVPDNNDSEEESVRAEAEVKYTGNKQEAEENLDVVSKETDSNEQSESPQNDESCEILDTSEKHVDADSADVIETVEIAQVSMLAQSSPCDSPCGKEDAKDENQRQEEESWKSPRRYARDEEEKSSEVDLKAEITESEIVQKNEEDDDKHPKGQGSDDVQDVEENENDLSDDDALSQSSLDSDDVTEYSPNDNDAFNMKEKLDSLDGTGEAGEENPDDSCVLISSSLERADDDVVEERNTEGGVFLKAVDIAKVEQICDDLDRVVEHSEASDLGAEKIESSEAQTADEDLAGKENISMTLTTQSSTELVSEDTTENVVIAENVQVVNIAKILEDKEDVNVENSEDIVIEKSKEIGSRESNEFVLDNANDNVSLQTEKETVTQSLEVEKNEPSEEVVADQIAEVESHESKHIVSPQNEEVVRDQCDEVVGGENENATSESDEVVAEERNEDVAGQNKDVFQNEDAEAVQNEDIITVPNEDIVAVSKEDTVVVQNEDIVAVQNEDTEAVQSEDIIAVPNEDAVAGQNEDVVAVPKEDTAVVQNEDSVAVQNEDTEAVRIEDTIAVPNENAVAGQNEDNVAVQNEDTLAVQNDDVTDQSIDSAINCSGQEIDITNFNESQLLNVCSEEYAAAKTSAEQGTGLVLEEEELDHIDFANDIELTEKQAETAEHSSLNTIAEDVLKAGENVKEDNTAVTSQIPELLEEKEVVEDNEALQNTVKVEESVVGDSNSESQIENSKDESVETRQEEIIESETTSLSQDIAANQGNDLTPANEAQLHSQYSIGDIETALASPTSPVESPESNEDGIKGSIHDTQASKNENEQGIEAYDNTAVEKVNGYDAAVETVDDDTAVKNVNNDNASTERLNGDNTGAEDVNGDHTGAETIKDDKITMEKETSDSTDAAEQTIGDDSLSDTKDKGSVANDIISATESSRTDANMDGAQRIAGEQMVTDVSQKDGANIVSGLEPDVPIAVDNSAQLPNNDDEIKEDANEKNEESVGSEKRTQERVDEENDLRNGESVLLRSEETVESVKNVASSESADEVLAVKENDKLAESTDVRNQVSEVNNEGGKVEDVTVEKIDEVSKDIRDINMTQTETTKDMSEIKETGQQFSIELLGTLEIAGNTKATGRLTPGFSQSGHTVLIWNEDTRHLTQYQFSDGKFSILMDREEKDWVQANNKYTMSSGLTYITRGQPGTDHGSVLEVYRGTALEELVVEQQVNGELIGITDNKALMFAEESSVSGELETVVTVRRLEDLKGMGEAAREKDVETMDVRCVISRQDAAKAAGAVDGQVAVVLRGKRQLLLYDCNGERTSHSLQYAPGWLSCTDTHLFVPDTHAPALHVYNWAGEQLHTFDRGSLGLAESDVAWDISPLVDNVVIMHCENGDPGNTHYFRAYRLTVG